MTGQSGAGLVLKKALVAPAERAVLQIVRDMGMDPGPLDFLHRSRHISFHLPRLGVVARARPLSETGALDSLRRELDIVTFLGERGAPVVLPSRHFAQMPHMAMGFAMSFWPFIEHDDFDQDRLEHREAALASLEALHTAFRDYSGTLPSYRHIIEECRALLERENSLPALAPTDRTFLKATHRHLVSRLDMCDTKEQPIHGDVHGGNIFLTARGPLWSDFEAASRGPVEWDYCSLTDITDDDGLASLMADLKSFCVSVWCWELAHMPEKLEAAQYHLDRLKDRYPRPG